MVRLRVELETAVADAQVASAAAQDAADKLAALKNEGAAPEEPSMEEDISAAKHFELFVQGIPPDAREMHRVALAAVASLLGFGGCRTAVAEEGVCTSPSPETSGLAGSQAAHAAVDVDRERSRSPRLAPGPVEGSQS